MTQTPQTPETGVEGFQAFYHGLVAEIGDAKKAASRMLSEAYVSPLVLDRMKRLAQEATFDVRRYGKVEFSAGQYTIFSEIVPPIHSPPRAFRARFYVSSWLSEIRRVATVCKSSMLTFPCDGRCLR